MKVYLLLLREGDEEYEKLSPRNIEELMKRYFEWTAKLREAGAYISCLKLNEASGLVARRPAGELADGSAVQETEFIEAGACVGGANAVAGVFLIRAADEREAQSLAAGCPILEYGGSAEIREVFSLFDSVRPESSGEETLGEKTSGD